MDNSLMYWLWMQDCLGTGAKVKSLVTKYNNAEGFYRAGESAWKNEGFAGSVISKLKRKKPESYLKIIEFCKEHKIYIL